MARMPTLHLVILAEHRGRWIAAVGLSTTSPTPLHLEENR